MAGVTQETFLARIRNAVAARRENEALPTDLASARVVPTSADAIALFMERVTDSAMSVARVGDEAALVEKVVAIIAEVNAKRVLIAPESFPARAQIVAKLREQSLELLDPENKQQAFEADVGITGVASAVAETGSIHMTSGGQRRRLASLAAPCHIAIVRADQILPDLLDWAARPCDGRPACEVLVSGPSKTADIELALVIGVHGPRAEHILILG